MEIIIITFGCISLLSLIVHILINFLFWKCLSLQKSWKTSTIYTHISFTWIHWLLTYTTPLSLSLSLTLSLSHFFVCDYKSLKLSCRHHTIIPDPIGMYFLRIRIFVYIITIPLSQLRKLIQLIFATYLLNFLSIWNDILHFYL